MDFFFFIQYILIMILLPLIHAHVPTHINLKGYVLKQLIELLWMDMFWNNLSNSEHRLQFLFLYQHCDFWQSSDHILLHIKFLSNLIIYCMLQFYLYSRFTLLYMHVWSVPVAEALNQSFQVLNVMALNYVSV